MHHTALPGSGAEHAGEEHGLWRLQLTTSTKVKGGPSAAHKLPQAVPSWHAGGARVKTPEAGLLQH